MKVVKIALFCFVCLLTPLAVFSGQVDDAKISNLVVSKQYGNIMFIKANKAKDSMPTCHTNYGWTYVLSLDTELESRIMSMLLAAKLSGSTVMLVGTQSCDAFGSIESLDYISLR